MNDEVFESKWNRELNAALEEYSSMPWADTYSRVAALMLRGIKENMSAVFPARVVDSGEEGPDIMLAVAKNEHSGENHTIMLTKPDDRYGMMLSMSLRATIKKIIADNELDGLVINPWTEAVFVLSKSFLKEAIELLEMNVEEKPAEHAEKLRRTAQTVYRIDTPRPMSRRNYKYAEAMIKGLKPESGMAVDIEFEDYIGEDEIQAMHFRRVGNKCHVELVNDMSEFGWDEPLVLAGDTDLDTALMILKRIGLYGENSGDIDEIVNGFKSV